MKLDTYRELMKHVHCGSFVNLTTATRPAVRAKSRKDNAPTPFGKKGEVVKVSTTVTQLGCDYSHLVNKHLAADGKEADFVAQEAKGVIRESPMLCFSKKDGEPMLTVNDVASKTLESHVFDASGTEITGERLDDYKANYAPTPSNYSAQGTTTEARIRNVKLANVRSIVVNGVEYK